MLERTTHDERKRTGNWWRRTYLGPHLPPTQLQERFWDDVCPAPELWHFDCWIWRRRSNLRPMIRRAEKGDDLTETVLTGTDEVTRADIDRFWNEFIPSVGGGALADWSTLADVVDKLRERYSQAELRLFERILGRYSVALCTRMEPLFLGRMKNPLIPVGSYFHLGMLTHQIAGEGRQAFERAYKDPMSTATTAESMTMESGGYFLALFRFDAFKFMARKQRLLDAVMNMAREGKPNEIPPVILKLQGWARSLFGCIGMSEFLMTQFKDERYEEPGSR